MARPLFTVIDTLILIICIPFYVIAVPTLMLHEWLLQRRPVRLGLEVTHWPAFDLREDYKVVDLARVKEGLVGIHRRRWGVLGNSEGAPPYPNLIEYISIKRFWVPHPLALRRRPS